MVSIQQPIGNGFNLPLQLQFEDGDVHGRAQGAVRFDYEALGLLRQGEGGEAQGEGGVVFEVEANGRSIKDQGINLLINQ